MTKTGKPAEPIPNNGDLLDSELEDTSKEIWL